jgi:5S rRNA maturation endonuclease (ribonuclease M5)
MFEGENMTERDIIREDLKKLRRYFGLDKYEIVGVAENFREASKIRRMIGKNAEIWPLKTADELGLEIKGKIDARMREMLTRTKWVIVKPKH